MAQDRRRATDAGRVNGGQWEIVRREFLRALMSPFTYSARANGYIIYGVLLGFPFPVMIWTYDYFLRYPDTLLGSLYTFRGPILWGSFLSPVISGVVFGALGTVRRAKEERIKVIISTLEDRIDERTRDAQDQFDGTLLALTSLLRARDQATVEHCRRVADLAANLALAKGLREDERRHLFLAGLLHDLGKVGFQDRILQGEKLSAADRDLLRDHPILAAEVLQAFPQLDHVRRLIVEHHERVDGTGYPNGLRGDQIHPHSHLLTAADIFDALTEDRTYRKALSQEHAILVMESGQAGCIDSDALALLRSHLAQERDSELEAVS